MFHRLLCGFSRQKIRTENKWCYSSCALSLHPNHHHWWHPLMTTLKVAPHCQSQHRHQRQQGAQTPAQPQAGLCSQRHKIHQQWPDHSSSSSSSNPQSCLWPHLGVSTGISLSLPPLGMASVMSVIIVKWQFGFRKQLKNTVSKF